MRLIAGVLGLVAGCAQTHVGPARVVDTYEVLSPTDEVDLLFAMDDAGNVLGQQGLLAGEMPDLLRALTTGDHDGDGTSERRPVRSLHIGFVTSDLGFGDPPDPVLCTSRGDDGVLRTSTSALGCRTEFSARTFVWEQGDDLDALIADTSCMARMGKGGCTFEQLLEATLKALSPAEPRPFVRRDYVPPTFFGGTSGHGDGANHGFLREHSVLAIVPFADDEDGSTPHPEMYWPSGGPVSDPPFLRVFRHPELLHPIDRYVEGFLQLRESPSRLVFAPITGIPSAIDPDVTSCEDILAAPLMQYVEATYVSPPMSLERVCYDVGFALPARRTVGVACELASRGANVALASVCAVRPRDLARIADRIADALEADCLPIDVDAECELTRRGDCDRQGWPTDEAGWCLVPRSDGEIGWASDPRRCPPGRAQLQLHGLDWGPEHQLRCRGEGGI